MAARSRSRRNKGGGEVSEEYSAEVRIWLEICTNSRGVRTLLDVASVGNGNGTLVAESVPWCAYVSPKDLGELCIQIDGTVRRYKIRILEIDNNNGDFKYEKLEPQQ